MASVMEQQGRTHADQSKIWRSRADRLLPAILSSQISSGPAAPFRSFQEAISLYLVISFHLLWQLNIPEVYLNFEN